MHPHPHHGGYIPQSAFSFPWTQPEVNYFVIQDEGVPDWVWIAGGALAGILLALLTRGR